MKSLFEEMGGTYRKEGDYFIPNLELPPTSDYQLGKYGRMRRSYLKEHRKVLYTNLTVSGTLFEHLAEIDRSCTRGRDRSLESRRSDGMGTQEKQHPQPSRGNRIDRTCICLMGTARYWLDG